MALYDERMAEPTLRASARPRPRRRLRLGSPVGWLLVLLVLLALLGGVGAAALLFGEQLYAGRIYPNVSVRGLSLSAYSAAQARAALERRYAAFLDQPVELTFADRRWKPTARELGLRIEFEQALATAAAAGREQSRLENARTVGAIWQAGVDIPLRLSVDARALQRYLLKLAPAVDAPPQSAELALVGDTVRLAPDRTGQQLLVDETARDVLAAAQTLSPQRVALRTRGLPPAVRAADLAATAAEARALLSAPLVLTAGEQRWQLGPAQIASWLRLRPASASTRPGALEIAIDQEPIRRALVPIAAAVRQAGGLPRVDWNGGQLKIIKEGGPDRGLDAARALTEIVAALRGTQRQIALPLIALPPSIDVTNLASLGITEPIGVGVSSFKASQNYRITNIRAGARQMHGLLIPPGATFSFNDNLGAVDASNGFVQGSAIVDNRTQKEWGGGLCQVSTTVFRAAFWGGLPIVERHEHAFRIGWYEELGEPPGLDAAIYTGVSDMRFTNDTGGWLLLQSEVDLEKQRLTIALYGSPNTRSVAMAHRVLERTPAPRKALYITDPTLPRGRYKRTDWARPGLKVEVYRTVRAADGSERVDTFPTEFQPWPNIYVRGGR
jgi:vancomycin resistance protein YoaR